MAHLLILVETAHRGGPRGPMVLVDPVRRAHTGVLPVRPDRKDRLELKTQQHLGH